MRVVEDESQLIIDAFQGSVSAFEALVVLYEPRIRRMLYSMTRDVQLTQDLCQESLLAAYRALHRMNGEELHFAPWLFRIALNQLRSEWRKRKHVTLVPFPTPYGNSNDALSEEYFMCNGNLEEEVSECDLVRRVLSQLPTTSAMCLLLDAEGFTYKEIAEIMHDSLSAVRSRLSRARQSFQRLYIRLNQEGCS
jgi:RNA polymerase sigma-70 factor (ECF subfamily)